MAAEMPRRRAGGAVDHRVPDPDRAPPLNLKSVRHSHDVDRIPAAAGALATDRAVAALVGVGGVAVEREAHRAAAARAFETDRHAATPRAMAFSGRCAGGRAGSRAGQIPDSRVSGKIRAPGTRTC